MIQIKQYNVTGLNFFLLESMTIFFHLFLSKNLLFLVSAQTESEM